MRAVRGMLLEINHQASYFVCVVLNFAVIRSDAISSHKTLCGGKPGGTLRGGTPGGLARPRCFGVVVASMMFWRKSIGVRG